MLRNLKNSKQNFLPWQKVAHVDDALFKFLQAARTKARSKRSRSIHTLKDKRRKTKRQNNKKKQTNEKPEDVGHFLV